MLEGKLDAVAPQLFTSDGTTTGQIQVADTAGFRVKQSAYLKDNTGNTLAVQVKRVLSETLLIVGQIDNKISSWIPLDISAWTVANGAMVGAESQNKNNIPSDDHYRAIYESDPVVADRIVQVDKYGNYYDASNPMPIIFDGTVAIGDVSIVDSTTKTPMKVNNDGSINVIVESVPSTNQTVVSNYNEIVAVPSGSTTQIVSYTCPPGYQAILQKCDISGDNIARYDLLINATVRDTVRTNFGSNLSESFDWTSGSDSGFVLNAGDIVSLQVLHNRPYTGTFEGRIQVLQINLS